jgi:hypothetical protein
MNRPIPPLPPENSRWSRRSFLIRAATGLREWIHQLEGMTGARLTELVMDIHREPAIAAQKVARAMTFVRGRQAATMAAVRAALPA